MAAYTQFGYGSYPTANQLLGGNVGQPSASSIMSHNAPSPLSGGSHENSLSPSGGSSVSSASSAQNGPLSPGAMSQASNHNAGSVPPQTGIATGGVLASNVSDNADASQNLGSGANMAGTSASMTGGSGSCCENGRPIMTDPVSGQTVCSCQYDSARLALSGYSRMPTGGVGVYGTAYASTEQNPYPSIGVDSSAFYTPLSNPYTLKESSAGSDMTAWSTAGLQPTTGYYSYDPTFAYGYGASYDLASRRKNATRESTATLKAWLNEHKKNPYPTKGEKIMLAIITKMTLTQVSTWFANARRRLKKENKMTWEPKNRTEDDDDDAMLSDEEKDMEKSDLDKMGRNSGSAMAGGGSGGTMYGQQMHKEHDQHKSNDPNSKHSDLKHDDDDDRKPENLTASRQLENYNTATLYGGNNSGGNHPNAYHPYQNPNHSHTQSLYYQQQQQQHQQQQQQLHHHHQLQQQHPGTAAYLSRDECGIPIPATKPKIWSVADTVANKTPPPTVGGQHVAASAAAAAYMNNGHPAQQSVSHQSSTYYSNTMPMSNNQIGNNSPLSMMSNYVNASSYSRLPTGGAPASGYPNSAASNYAQMNSVTASNVMMHSMHSSSSSSSNSSSLQQQYGGIQALQQNQGRLGFPEIQPDTPPQTPPNMKHANGMANGVSMGNTPPSSLAYVTSGVGGSGTTNLNTSYGSDASSSVASRTGMELQ